MDTLLRLVLDRVPVGPPYYPPDQLSEHPERFFLGEIVREAIFHLYRDEIPYSTQAVVVTVEERPGQKTLVAVDVVVERDSQKAILVGKGGSALKRLGTAARGEMAAIHDRQPVMMRPAAWGTWLDTSSTPDELLAAAADDAPELAWHEVGKMGGDIPGSWPTSRCLPKTC